MCVGHYHGSQGTESEGRIHRLGLVLGLGLWSRCGRSDLDPRSMSFLLLTHKPQQGEFEIFTDAIINL